MNKLQQKFNSEYIVSVWDHIRFWWLKWRVKNTKLSALYEANLDLLFLQTEYPNILAYNDNEDRAALAELNKKPLVDRTDEDLMKIEELEEKITHAKAIKQSYRQNEAFRAELKNYLNMINTWNQKDEDNSDL